MKRLNERIREHNQGAGAKYTRSRCPVVLLVNTCPMSKQQAYKTEFATKKLRRVKKPAYLKKQKSTEYFLK
jgi:putative endonuclease